MRSGPLDQASSTNTASGYLNSLKFVIAVLSDNFNLHLQRCHALYRAEHRKRFQLVSSHQQMSSFCIFQEIRLDPEMLVRNLSLSVLQWLFSHHNTSSNEFRTALSLSTSGSSPSTPISAVLMYRLRRSADAAHTLTPKAQPSCALVTYSCSETAVHIWCFSALPLNPNPNQITPLNILAASSQANRCHRPKHCYCHQKNSFQLPSQNSKPLPP